MATLRNVLSDHPERSCTESAMGGGLAASQSVAPTVKFKKFPKKQLGSIATETWQTTYQRNRVAITPSSRWLDRDAQKGVLTLVRRNSPQPWNQLSSEHVREQEKWSKLFNINGGMMNFSTLKACRRRHARMSLDRMKILNAREVGTQKINKNQ